MSSVLVKLFEKFIRFKKFLVIKKERPTIDCFDGTSFLRGSVILLEVVNIKLMLI